MAGNQSLDIVQIRVALAEIEPAIWRRVQVPADFTLRRLHDVIQAVMGWWDYHLYQYRIGVEIYERPEIADADGFGARSHDDRNRTLGELIEQGVERFTYTYDFGDDWRHEIEIEQTLAAERDIAYPILVAGERCGPPEDCGGPFGYPSFLDAITNPDHQDHDEIFEWYGGPFDPESIDLAEVETRLNSVRRQRHRSPR